MAGKSTDVYKYTGAVTTVMVGAVINWCTDIGKGCIMNTRVTIDYIEDYVRLSPVVYAAGSLKIGKGAWL